MRDPLAIQVAQEIVLFAQGDKSTALNAIADLTEGDPSQDNHIIKLPFTARVYKILVQGGHYNPQKKKVELINPPLEFGSKLLGPIKSYCTQWATGEGSFVTVSLLESLRGSELDELKKQLKKDQKVLTAKAGQNKGTKLVLDKI
jgi:pumilio homology domain family member 6